MLKSATYAGFPFDILHILQFQMMLDIFSMSKTLDMLPVQVHAVVAA